MSEQIFISEASLNFPQNHAGKLMISLKFLSSNIQLRDQFKDFSTLCNFVAEKVSPAVSCY